MFPVVNIKWRVCLRGTLEGRQSVGDSDRFNTQIHQSKILRNARRESYKGTFDRGEQPLAVCC